MRHGSLFSGIGGFNLAAEWMGWENVFHCENNSFCQRILKHYWPDAESYGDITTTDFTQWRGKVDIISGGFPCQPFSSAGKRKGAEDNRYLWPEMLRAVREIQPKWVVGENVYGLLNLQRGLVFERVQADLEAEGYITQAYVLPACAVNAPHRRDRVWIVANSEQGVCAGSRLPNKSHVRFMENRWTSTTDNPPLSSKWFEYNTDRRTLRDDDGFSEGVDRIAALGNSIVPQVAYEIFKAIEETEKSFNQ